MIKGKINGDVYTDDAVLFETKPKIVINNQEITDLETFNKVVDSIKEKDKEIERLNNIIKEYEKFLISVKQFVYLDELKTLKEGK